MYIADHRMDARNELYAGFAIICWERFRRNILIAFSRSIREWFRIVWLRIVMMWIRLGLREFASLKIVSGFIASRKIRNVEIKILIRLSKRQETTEYFSLQMAIELEISTVIYVWLLKFNLE